MREDINSSPAALKDLYGGQDGIQQLFNAIDDLRTLQLGTEELPIPQLVVVGEQSSGKSSVLESIARIRLPVGTGICTRFPIEVVLRRSEKRRLSMRILPGPASKNDQQAVAAMKAFHVAKDDSDANIDIIADIEKAAGIIGVPIYKEAQGNRGLRYSDDVLRITHQGPDLSDLTLIDLPGLFNRVTGEQSEADKIKVQDMVKRYVEDRKSIVLLVCKGNNDYSVNSAANIIDATAESRTLGILTHLDNIPNMEQAFKLHRRELEKKFELGWHFLVNTPNEDPNKRLSFETRDALERQIFETKIVGLPSKVWGVVQLRKILGKLLLKLILDSLPTMIDGIKKVVKRRKAELKGLPTARTTEYQQRVYLLEHATAFVGLAKAATCSHYSDYADFFGDYDRAGLRGIDGPDPKAVRKRKLQSTIRGLNRVFSTVIQQHGRSTIIDNQPCTYQDPDPSERHSALEEFEAPEQGHQNPAESEIDVSDDTGNADANNEYNVDESDRPSFSIESEGVADLLSTDEFASFVPTHMRRKYFKISKPDPINIRDYETELQRRQQEWLGKEPRSEISIEFYVAVFRKLTSNWDDITQTHLAMVWQATEEFIDEALNYNMPKQLQHSVKSFIIYPRLEMLWQTAETRLKELVRCHRKEIHAFLDTGPDFFPESPFREDATSADNLLGWAQTLAENLRSVDDIRVHNFFDLLSSGNSSGLNVDYKSLFGENFASKILEQLLKTSVPQPVLDTLSLAWRGSKSNADSRDTSPELEAVRRIIYHGERYYKMTVPSFVSYINALIVEGIILKGLRDSIFTFGIVTEIDTHTLQLVAGETQDLSERRSTLSAQVSKLQEVSRVLQAFRSYRA
ncbi:P-loop containing nucleoside triphosphate hydrolase protein [Aspergillus pseudoustus]|uniref:P-loop containing nucleoside triphosphate hydrolase protein n=1 Tax=Aspergillus pseudoustus TaxID=1810923 RepID=A0ABR4JYW0_9EURO